MKSLKSITRYAIFVLVALIFIAFTACAIYMISDEDFDSYTHQKFEVSFELVGDVYDVNNVVAQLETYIKDYSEYDMSAIYGIYRFKSDLNSRTAMYAFNSDILKDGSKATLEFEINLNEKKVYSVKYEKGEGKRVPSYPSQSFEYEYTNVMEVYYKYCAENSVTDPALSVFLENSDIRIIQYND